LALFQRHQRSLRSHQRLARTDFGQWAGLHQQRDCIAGMFHTQCPDLVQRDGIAAPRHERALPGGL
jgi:hypothetical protein